MTLTHRNELAAAILTRETKKAPFYVDFSSNRQVLRDEATFTRLAANAIAYLVDDIDPETFDPLSFEVFRCARGAFIADVTLAVGGPTIRARFESDWDELTITASWGGDYVELTAKEGPLVEWVKDYAELC